jgi:hypothetical protein
MTGSRRLDDKVFILQLPQCFSRPRLLSPEFIHEKPAEMN